MRLYSVGRPEPRIGVIVTMGYLDEFWFLVVLGVSHRDDHFVKGTMVASLLVSEIFTKNLFLGLNFSIAIS